MRNLLVLLLVFGFVGVAGATSPYDDFESPKTVGDLDGQGGGTGFTGNWTADSQITVESDGNQFWRYTADSSQSNSYRLFEPLVAGGHYFVYLKFRASQKGGNAADEWYTNSPGHFQLSEDEAADPLHLKINQSGYFFLNDLIIMGMDTVPDWYTAGGHTQAQIDDYYMNYVNQWAPWKFDLDLTAQTITWYWMDNSGNWDLVGATIGMGNAGDVSATVINRILLGGKCNVNDVTIEFDDFVVTTSDELYTAWAPIPADDATSVPPATDLSWMIPIDANEIREEYRVYFSTDSTFASTTPIDAGPLSAGERRASVTNAQIGGPLSLNTSYYWRVDCVDPNATPAWRIGDLWSFEANVALPTLIAPANGTTDAEIDVDLEWSSDPLTTASKVYIKKPDDTVWSDRGIQTSPYNPWNDLGDTMMAWDTEYLWKIEELDDGSNVLLEGAEWSFKVRELSCENTSADIDGSGDCIVNLADFSVMASQWLDCNWDDGGMASPCP